MMGYEELTRERVSRLRIPASRIETLVTTQEPVAPSRLAPSIPLELEAICLKCLEKAPHQRYATARELAEDLQRFLNGQPVKARRISTIQRTWKWIRRHPQRVTLIVALSFLPLPSASGLVLTVDVSIVNFRFVPAVVVSSEGVDLLAEPSGDPW